MVVLLLAACCPVVQDQRRRNRKVARTRWCLQLHTHTSDTDTHTSLLSHASQLYDVTILTHSLGSRSTHTQTHLPLASRLSLDASPLRASTFARLYRLQNRCC